jgi:hypothetical protein
MSLPACKECTEIYQGLVALMESSHRTKPGPNATPQQLAEWLDLRVEDNAGRTRERTALSTLKARLIEHQKLTGHHIPLPLPPGGLISPN